MDLSDFDYVLPPDAISQAPAEPRDASRLMVIDRAAGTSHDHRFAELPELLRRGDCVVVNDSRVIPARVMAEDLERRCVELLFIEPIDSVRWRALGRPGRRCRPGARLTVGGELGAQLGILATEPDGVRIVERRDGSVGDLLEAHGVPPLPPYIARHRKPDIEDRERYQTVYARVPGSVAAPTAGLHFSEAMLGRLRAGDIEIHAVTLHVGPATFRPIKTARVEDHPLTAERVTVSPPVAGAVNRARREGRRVVAVGTTTTRALEGCGNADGTVQARDGTVSLYITPGYRFRVVDALVTNFHLPRSSLLVLVSAFAGRELILAAYRHAVEAGYTFYSYGDATLIA
ncbi:MAG: tRNA preQ1(34) S-adenosylmethionine ribosyltransferase-isomerase QueA [Candidatus Rokubacteria bacterium]|nr:tRNA preQ1(34) S-adenosylmethionine ribosyltransferase-isomerase QueA [Candidatus Rokubacteria bacterium]